MMKPIWRKKNSATLKVCLLSDTHGYIEDRILLLAHSCNRIVHAGDAEFFPDGRFRSNFLANIGYWEGSRLHPRGPCLAFDEAVTLL